MSSDVLILHDEHDRPRYLMRRAILAWHRHDNMTAVRLGYATIWVRETPEQIAEMITEGQE